MVGFVTLPLAFATGSETRLGFTLPLSVTVSEVAVWVALALMVVAVTLVEQATRLAARRGNVTPATVTWIVFVASSALGGVDGGPDLVMGVLVLSLSFATFAPFVQRLPNHFSVRA